MPKAYDLCQMVGTETTIPRLTGNRRHRANATTIQSGMAQNGEACFRVNVLHLFLDYMLTYKQIHRTNAFALQFLVPNSRRLHLHL